MTRPPRPGHPHRSLLALTAPLLLVTIAMTGCTADDDGDSRALPNAAGAGASAATTPTPSPTPTSAKPDLAVPPWPTGAREPTTEGLKIAAEYYFDDLVDYMSATGDLAPFSDVCPGNLSFCHGFTTNVYRHHKNGHHLIMGEFILKNVETRDEEDEYGTVYYKASGSIGSTQRFDASGVLLKTYEFNEFEVEATFIFEDGRWLITGAYMEST